MGEEELNTVVQSIFEHVDLQGHIDPYEMYIPDAIGFLALTSQGRSSLIAFGEVPEWTDEFHPPTRTPDTRFSDYPKGVGYRVANTPTAQLQPHRRGLQPPISAVEIIDFDDTDVLDIRRQGSAWRLGGIARHAALLAQAKIAGSHAALDRVERAYGENGGVLMNVPPSWLTEQEIVKGVKHAIEPSMLLIRDPGVTIRRVGEVDLRALTSKG